MNQTPPSTKLPPDYAGVLFAALVMAALAWYGLYLLVSTQIPRVGQRWLFFVLLHIAVTGTVMPFVRYLNIRLTPLSRPLPSSGVIVRQSVWIGIFAVTCAWMQIPRVLSLPIAGFIALMFIVIEVFLRSREMSSER